MKKIMTLLTLIFVITLQAQTNEIKIADNIEETYYLMKNTIRESSEGDSKGAYIECWIKSKSKGDVVVDKKNYKNTYQMTKILVNCYYNQFKFLDVVTYSQDGVSIASMKGNKYNEFINAIPGSTGGDIVNGICKNR